MSRRRGDEVFDCSGSGVELPLALRKAAGIVTRRDPQETGATTCAFCGVRYFLRPEGSPLAENGRCRNCATKREEAAVVPIRRRRASA